MPSLRRSDARPFAFLRLIAAFVVALLVPVASFAQRSTLQPHPTMFAASGLVVSGAAAADQPLGGVYAARPKDSASFEHLTLGRERITWSGNNSVANSLLESITGWNGTLPPHTTANLNHIQISEGLSGDHTSTVNGVEIGLLWGGANSGSQNRQTLQLENKNMFGDVSASPTNGGGFTGLSIYTLTNYYTTADEGVHTVTGTSKEGSCTLAVSSAAHLYGGDAITGPGIPKSVVRGTNRDGSFGIFPCAGPGAGSGTFTATHYGGVLWAMNPVVGAPPAPNHGDLYPTGIIGAEWDCGGDEGSHPAIRMCAHFAGGTLAHPETQGSQVDDAVSINGSWRYGITFSKGGVGWPFTASSGTMIGSGENYFNTEKREALCGICLPDVTFTNFALQFPNFTVDGSGNVAASSLTLASAQSGADPAVRTTGGGLLDLTKQGVLLPFGTPASSHAACKPPQFQFDRSYIYTCIAPNTWRRAATSAF